MRAMILVFVSILFSASAQANYLEVYRKVQKAITPVDTIDAFLAKRFEGTTFGVSAFLLVTERWAEAYAGPTYTPVEWLELSMSLGGEQTLEGELGLRYSTSVWTGVDAWSLLAIVEANNAVFQGDDIGVWYDVTTTYQLFDWMALGLRDRRFIGAGPNLVFTYPAAKISLWTTWAPIDPEGLGPDDPTRFLLGTRVGF